MADAGHDDAAGARELLRRRGRRELGAERRQRLAHRREIARAVIDQRDHSSPFVLGSIFASRASFAHATRSARANALNTASIVMMARAAVQHLDVHVGARADREAFEEVVDELGLQIADRATLTFRSTTACGRPPRSMAATASVSSIGMTK